MAAAKVTGDSKYLFIVCVSANSKKHLPLGCRNVQFENI